MIIIILQNKSFPAQVSHSVIVGLKPLFEVNYIYYMYIRYSNLHIGEYSQSGALVLASCTRSSAAGRQRLDKKCAQFLMIIILQNKTILNL